MSLSILSGHVYHGYGASRSGQSNSGADVLVTSSTNSPGAPLPDPAGKNILTVATFNADNVFIGPPEPGHNGEDQPTKSEAALAAAGRVIMNTRADVIALQEVHDKKALDTLVDKYMTGNPYPYRVLVPGNDSRGINVAVLSKYPITNVKSNADVTFDANGKQQHFSRDFLEATIKVSDKFEFTLGTTHLKAHAGGASADAKRLGEGRTIHKIVAEELAKFPERRYVVCGDFNDPESAPAVKAVVSKDVQPEMFNPLQGSAEISHPVTNRRIDFLLLSDKMKEAYVPNSEHVINDPSAAAASDHRPIVARFEIPQ